ncbi:MAG: helix-turn-helix domain-containing protein [Deltaproteobacteria bacterium]|nr:helix-turn-helix domain-containing protein [Deltaproteobacteria bacterium]
MSVGEYLAQQRRLRNISMDELCEITKIPRRNLDLLEAGAFDEHPDGFARGFVRTVAEALGLDPDEAVMRLMQEPEADADPAARFGTRLVLQGAGLLLAAGLTTLLWKLGSGWLAGAPEAELQPVLTYRRDAVGELAREQELVPPAQAEPRSAP